MNCRGGRDGVEPPTALCIPFRKCQVRVALSLSLLIPRARIHSPDPRASLSDSRCGARAERKRKRGTRSPKRRKQISSPKRKKTKSGEEIIASSSTITDLLKVVLVSIFEAVDDLCWVRHTAP